MTSDLVAAVYNNTTPAVLVSTAVGIAGGAAFAAGPGLGVMVAHAAGFRQEGTVAGTPAASVQSFFGNVGAGSAIATLQSAGAGGSGAVRVNHVANTVAGMALFGIWYLVSGQF